MPKNICLVAIGCDYQNSNVELKGCINDAMDISNTFINICEKHKFNLKVELMCDHDKNKFPSRNNILEILKNKINLCSQGKLDNLFFYFAGHGYQIKINLMMKLIH